MKTKLTYGSLFSGVGGFDMGFDQEGYECVFQVEWDKHCQKILAKHWPKVPKWSDVQDVNGAEIPPCDVLTFGSPCQDLSVAGKRAGLDGTKSSMFYEATRIIKEMRNATKSVYPRVVVWENVPGALSSNNGADFGAVIDTLADIGAVDIHWSVLDAQYFGVPQRRRRIFVVAIFDIATSERCPDPLLPVIKGSRGDFAKGRKARKDIARTAQAGIDSGGQWAAGSTDADILSTSVCSKWSKGSGGPSGSEHYNMVVETEPNVLFGGGSFAQYVEGQVSTLKLSGGDLGGGSENLVVQDPVVPLKTSNTKANGMNVGEPGDPSYTLDTGGSMAVAYSIREDAKNDNFSATETDIALCLNGLRPSTQSHHAQIFIAEPVVYDGYNQKLDNTGIHRSLRIGRDSSDFVAQPIIFENSFRDGPRIGDDICHTLPAKMGSGGGNTPMLAEVTYSFDTQFGSNAAVFENQSPTLKATQQSPSVTMPGLAVRRLTPLECERLMGWPNDHTRWTADGKEQADTNRYKQCGNGVATPVAKWIAKHLKNILITNDDQ